MADLDAFESPAPEQQATEEDPAAAFLAREQDELKGLEDDNFGAENGTQGEGTDFDPFGAGEQTPQQTDDFGQAPVQTETFGDGGFAMPNETEETPGGYDDFGTGYDDTGMPGGYDDFGIGYDDTGMQPTDSYSAISQVDKQRAEPEKIKIWREENARRIEKKDEEEKKRMEEWREIAKKELDDWYKHHDEQMTKTKENNRESEAAFVAERDQTQPGEEWEKICRLCEFNPKNSKNTKDISRMRQILLQLKQTPLVR